MGGSGAVETADRKPKMCLQFDISTFLAPSAKSKESFQLALRVDVWSLPELCFILLIAASFQLCIFSDLLLITLRLASSAQIWFRKLPSCLHVSRATNRICLALPNVFVCQ